MGAGASSNEENGVIPRFSEPLIRIVKVKERGVKGEFEEATERLKFLAGDKFDEEYIRGIGKQVTIRKENELLFERMASLGQKAEWLRKAKIKQKA